VPGIEVLLATYNGGRFIAEQIESILRQDECDFTILARDDGSTDGTPDILQDYVERFPTRIRAFARTGNDRGIINNFRSLLQASAADYVCFSDQDDVWLPDKLTRSRRAMEELQAKWGMQVPALVFTDLRVVDANLSTLYPSFWERMRIDPEVVYDFPGLLVNFVVTGCTVMANRPLVDLAVRMPQEASMHDSWVGLIASAFGRAAFVREPTVLYRQHGGNATGVGPDESATILSRLGLSRRNARQFIQQWQASQQQAAAFLTIYGSDLPSLPREQLLAFRQCETNPSRIARVATFLRHRFYPQGRLSKLTIVFYLWSKQVQSEAGALSES
jgi:Glycosyl transferase family 2